MTTNAAILASLGRLASVSASCVVEDDTSCVVRHARPITEGDRAKIREQAIEKLVRDYDAMTSREARIRARQVIRDAAQ